MLIRQIQLRPSFKKLMPLVYFSTSSRRNTETCLFNDVVGVCIRVHFHFKTKDIDTFPRKTELQLPSPVRDLENLTSDGIKLVKTKKQVLTYMGSSKEEGPQFVALRVNLELGNDNSDLKIGKCYVESINVGGTINISEALNDGNIFIYNGVANCGIKYKTESESE